MKKLSLLTLALAGLFLTTNAQQPVKKLSANFINYFAGYYNGAGTFSNGKPIKANAEIHLAMDSSWLIYDHKDVPPNQYNAHSLWGMEANGDIIAFIFDNFGGHRQFKGKFSAENGLLLNNAYLDKNGNKHYEHFIYQQLPAGGPLKMSYEVSQDSITWRMIDTLHLIRNKK
ncbi:hypothetical protein [Chitinophaga sp. Cy-1792]|uniref:hypothetical protein n=1 Tax=Chitinophaga sp. Cy-1792 TaxID=2608339 RepID=UPI001421CD33|nr:hypothetical protein [Chitinophaga sp. Cy-1792]NIG56539.1 hypothetical protein [Chitinophaga sp. Cy-1792]